MVSGLRRFGFVLIFLAGGFGARTGAAQPAAPGTEQGVLRITGWPASAAQAEAAAGSERRAVLPALDTLSLGYRYAVVEHRPYLTFALEWVPASHGYLGRRRVSYRRLPADLRMTSAAFRADVYVGGERVTEWTVALDSLALGPHPDIYVFELKDRPWDALFVRTPAEEARRYFEKGFELRGLELVHVTFAAAEQIAEEEGRRPRVGRPRPDSVIVYPEGPRGGVDIWLGGIFRRPPPLGVGPEPEGSAPRGDDLGRSRGDAGPSDRDRRAGVGSDHEDPRRTAERGRADRDPASAEEPAGSDSGPEAEEDEESRTTARKGGARRGGKQADDRDEDEDEDKLKGPALTALAALGVIAYTGGTVGYYGNAELAPIGLAAGFVRSGGGLLLQAGVNEALLTDGPGPKHFMGRLLGFYGPNGFSVQPAVAVGALAVEEGPDVEVRPSLSLGAAGNFGPVLLLGAYDVLNGGPEFGLAFNFRSRGFAASED